MPFEVLTIGAGVSSTNRGRVLRGFTLVELIVVLAITAILATIALPLSEIGLRRTQEEELRSALRVIRKALDDYKAAVDEGKISRNALLSGYPKTLNALVDGVPNERDPERRMLYFLRAIPRDPFADASITDPARTWRLRSYQSSAADFRDGEDVYDVKSASPQMGLNGVPYANW